METASSTDMGIGVGLLFGALGLLGALAMYTAGTGGNQLTAGLAFAGAMLASAIVVSALHVYA